MRQTAVIVLSMHANLLAMLVMALLIPHGVATQECTRDDECAADELCVSRACVHTLDVEVIRHIQSRGWILQTSFSASETDSDA